MSWYHGSFSIGRVLVFIVFFTMFDKTTVVLIQEFYEFFTFHGLRKVQLFFSDHITHGVILFTYILKIKLQSI